MRDQARFENEAGAGPRTSASIRFWWWAPVWLGASAAATLGELGYNVKCFCFQDSPQQGAQHRGSKAGINVPQRNYHSDGDSVFRLFYDAA